MTGDRLSEERPVEAVEERPRVARHLHDPAVLIDEPEGTPEDRGEDAAGHVGGEGNDREIAVQHLQAHLALALTRHAQLRKGEEHGGGHGAAAEVERRGIGEQLARRSEERECQELLGATVSHDCLQVVVGTILSQVG